MPDWIVLKRMNPLSVSALTTHIVMLFERDEVLRDVAVLGEVSNWKRVASGHVYFSVKDSGAAIGAVMWRTAAIAHTWLPRDGDQIIAHGYVGVYPERGAYQLYVNRILPAGRGQLYAQFEQLKAKLEAEGLFESARKRPIPVARQEDRRGDERQCCGITRYSARAGPALAAGRSDCISHACTGN